MTVRSITAQHHRRGILLTMELLMILPLLLLVLSAIVQCSLLATARTQVTHAAVATAQQISVAPLSAEDIRKRLRAALGGQLAAGAIADVVIPDEPEDVGRLRVQVRMDHILPALPGQRLITGNSQWLVVQVPIFRGVRRTD